MTNQFALPMIITVERLMRELLDNELIQANQKILQKMQEALNIADAFLQHKKRINTIMMNQLGYIFSEIRELLLVEGKRRYNKKQDHQSKKKTNERRWLKNK